MNGTALILAAAAAVAMPAAAATSPLANRVLAPGELAPGYMITSVRTLDLQGYARAVGLEPKAQRELARRGFVAAALETLRGPAPIPAQVGTSQSSVLRFPSATQATGVLRWIKRTYGATTPPGVHRSAFPVPGIANSWNVHYSSAGAGARIDEYNTTFALGPYVCEVDIFSRDRALSPRRAATTVTAYYKRLHHT